MYVALLNKLMISEGVDFIFEEASGLGPTIAEKLALEQLAFGHYVDIDPARNDRPDFRHSHQFQRTEYDWLASDGGVCELAELWKCTRREKNSGFSECSSMSFKAHWSSAG